MGQSCVQPFTGFGAETCGSEFGGSWRWVFGWSWNFSGGIRIDIYDDRRTLLVVVLLEAP